MLSHILDRAQSPCCSRAVPVNTVFVKKYYMRLDRKSQESNSENPDFPTKLRDDNDNSLTFTLSASPSLV